jgi:hypothetical protein
MRVSLEQGAPLPVEPLLRPGWVAPLQARFIPPPSAKPAYLAHARLRRASPMTHYAVGAALEALGGDADVIRSGGCRLGIVACTMTGGISYSRRFYEEVLHDPATASPMIFPETVFNAPASHLSAFLNTSTVNYTLVGDAGTFLQGLAVAAQWLEEGVADACVVIGAEELDWTAGDALRLFERNTIYATGAGALYLKGEGSPAAPVELAAVTDLFPGGGAAARKVRAQLPAGASNELLCSSEPKNAAWSDWTGGQLVPKAVLGEAFVASAAWQCVVACDAIQRCQYEAANVSIAGGNQPAIGARFVKPDFLKTKKSSLP